MIVEVNDDRGMSSAPYSPELIVIRDKSAEDRMICLLAAETIQLAYRGYISCKAAKKMRRVKSTDLLVKNMAAETIIKGIKNKIALNKSKSITSKHAEDKASYVMGEEKDSSISFIDDSKIERKENDRKQVKSNEPNDQDESLILSINDSAPKSNRYEYYDAKESKETKDSKETIPEITKPPLFPLDIKFDTNNENKRINKKKDTRLRGKSKKQDKQIETERKLEAKEADVSSARTISKSIKSTYNSTSARERSINSISLDTTTKKTSTKQVDNEVYVNKFAPPVPFIESPPDRYRVIDEAFANALNAQCSIVSLQTHEIAMVLDALGYELMDSISDLKNRSSEIIEMPMLSNAPLAAVLSFHGRNKSLVKDLENFSVSEQMANVAVKHLSSLVQGPWLKVRALLLKYFNLSKEQVIRPMLWPSNWIHEFTKTLQFPEKHFSMLSGKAFLEIPKSFLKDVYGIIPSLLQARFVLYQHLFRLLDEWWDKGIRPNDLYKEKDSPIKPTKASRKQESLKIIKAAKDWGKFEGKYSLYFDSGKTNKINVEICHFQMLLDTIVPLNRAYGWGIQLDRLTLLCGKVSGLKGYVSIQSSIDQDVKGCRWVTLHKPIQTTRDLLEALPDSLYSKTIEYNGETDRILVPISCMRPVDSNDTAIKPEDITVGAVVKVISEEGLRQSLERFDWWDRPSANTQSSILGLVGEVISISELASCQRVGVRFSEKNIIDALPIDALVLVENNDSSATIDRIKTSDVLKKDIKKKKESSKKLKKKISTAQDLNTLPEAIIANQNSSPVIPPLPLDVLSSASPMTLKLFSKADKLFRAVDSIYGSDKDKESKDDDFVLSDRALLTSAHDNNIIPTTSAPTTATNNDNKKMRPSTAKERRLYRPIPSEEPKNIQIDDMVEEKKWVREFNEDPTDSNINDDDMEEEPNSARYSWMKSIEIIKNSPRNEENQNTSPDSHSPRSKTPKLSIYHPQFDDNDYHNPISPKRRPKSAPNKRDKNIDNLDKNNDRIGPRIYNKMISHDNDYEPDQLPVGGPSLIYNQPIGVAGRNVNKIIDKENNNLIYTPSPYIPEPPKFKYMPKSKEVSKSKEVDIINQLDSNQLGVLGYAFGKNLDEIIESNNNNNTINDNNTNNNINNAKDNKKKKKDTTTTTTAQADEPIIGNKNNIKSLGSYLCQQQVFGDFFEGQNLNVVANIALANKIADNAEKSREELLAIELAKNEKLFDKQDKINEKNMKLKNRKVL